MRAIWSYRLETASSGVLDADVVQTRSAPYVAVDVRVYPVGEPRVVLARGPFRTVDLALAGMHAVARPYGVVTVAAAVPLRVFEPPDARLLFAAAREHVATWCAAAGAPAAHIDPTAPWSDVAAGLLALPRRPAFRQTASDALQEGQGVLLRIIERLTDVLIWEVRQQRAARLHPGVPQRHHYPRSTLNVVAGLEALTHLARDYRPPRPAAVATVHVAPVIDLRAWKQARTVGG